MNGDGFKGESKEVYIKTYYNQIVKSQRQKENFKAAREKVTHHIQVSCNDYQQVAQ